MVINNENSGMNLYMKCHTTIWQVIFNTLTSCPELFLHHSRLFQSDCHPNFVKALTLGLQPKLGKDKVTHAKSSPKVCHEPNEINVVPHKMGGV
jgi:hypothetical protein